MNTSVLESLLKIMDGRSQTLVRSEKLDSSITSDGGLGKGMVASLTACITTLTAVLIDVEDPDFNEAERTLILTTAQRIKARHPDNGAVNSHLRNLLEKYGGK